MKKEEAIKFLSGTKVYVDGKSKEIQEKLFELGFKWVGGESIVCACDKPFLFIDKEMGISDSACMKHFKNAGGMEVKAEEILSIEIDKEEYQFKPFEQVLVRDNNGEDWRCSIFSHYLNDNPYKFAAINSSYKQCVPYQGNEHLVGTNDSPKQ